MNTFDNPKAITPAPLGGTKIQDSQVLINIPPKSIGVLELQ